ncbi:hypothetical protein BH24CHL4_BH24CHL4_26390 [soil metagenome]
MTKRLLIGAAVFIWTFIKLPQKYWIHIAHLDTTDLIKEKLFGVPADSPFSEIIADNVHFFIGLWVLLGTAAAGINLLIKDKLPAAGWKLAFDAEARGRDVTDEQIELQAASMRGHVFTIKLLETIALLSLVMIIFTRIIPGTASKPSEQAIGIAVFIILDTVVSEFVTRRRGYAWDSAIGGFVVNVLVNGAIVFAFRGDPAA